MNEAEWLVSSDATPMLRYLVESRTSERKLRLLACACCRRIWNLLPDPRSRRAIEVAERFADGQATLLELARARTAVVAVPGIASWAAYWAVNTKASGPLWNAFAAAAAAPARQATVGAVERKAEIWEAAQASSVREQSELIREIIGNPFRPSRVDPAWLLFDGGIVRQLAEAIYEDRAYDRMPILGDALEEAGCADQDILEHCRKKGEHVRGCWPVDLLLGKQ